VRDALDEIREVGLALGLVDSRRFRAPKSSLKIVVQLERAIVAP
jgi:hypothetical protein